MRHQDGETLTRDFYLACVMKAVGMSLLRLEGSVGQPVYFVFDDPDHQAELLTRQYWDHQVTVDAKLLIDTVYELKTRLHSGEGRV